MLGFVCCENYSPDVETSQMFIMDGLVFRPIRHRNMVLESQRVLIQVKFDKKDTK